MRKEVNLALYYVTDDNHPSLDALVSTTVKAVRGGATLVQLRSPSVKAGELLQQAKALLHALHGSDVPLIINDRPDVAFASGAAGAHLGQGDLSVEAARMILGPEAIIGLSITAINEMQHVSWDLVSHIGVGPVLSKGVKLDATEPMGFKGLAECVKLSSKPVVAIGGMNIAAVEPCIHSGASGLAVVSAISRAADPEVAAHTLRCAIDAALTQRGH